MSDASPRRALISVSDKTDLGPFAAELVKLGFEILSTGGTGRFLKEQGIPVIDVADYTGFPEMMDGRLKTLHPRIHGALLGRPGLAADAAAMAQFGIVPIELVVVNLYPFAQTIARPDVTVAEAIEQIDIGGPGMVRSAAKNHAYVGVVTRPAQYPAVLAALRTGKLSDELRRLLAQAAFEITASYDRAIADYFARLSTPADADQRFPPTFAMRYPLREQLRYGENPHQAAAFYVSPQFDAASLAAARRLNGKELSYNNLLDLDAALAIVREFPDPAAVVVKHNNPCGCAAAGSLAVAFDRAYQGDPVSAFGGIIGFNRRVDLATAESLCEPNRFIEAIIAPGYDPDALKMLTTKPKWKANVRLMECGDLTAPRPGGLECRSVTGGLLVQERDDQTDPVDDWQVVTKREPTEAERRDLMFGWLLCKHVRSNAIVLVRQTAAVGIGAGQMSRLDASFLAAFKAGERSQGSVVASDAFFPFRDGVDEAAKAGVTAVIQPGGSKGDSEVIAACNEHSLAMIFTGRRHFKH